MNIVRQGFLILVGFSLAGSCASMENTKKRGLSPEEGRENKKSKQLKKDINARNEDGETALIRACKDNDKTGVTALLNQGADPNIQDNSKSTALIWACIFDHTEIVTVLLNKGVDLNSKDRDGNTALIWACIKNYTGIVKLLLDKGADQYIRGEYGNTALMWSCFRGDTKFVTLLVCHYSTLLTMNPEEKLTYLCNVDKEFRAEAENFLLSLKRNERETGLRIPKYLRFQMLLEAWRQAHPTDYRCALWFGTYEEKIEAFKAFIDTKNLAGKTAFVLAQQQNETDIVTFLTALETALAQGEQVVREFLHLYEEKKDHN